MPYLGGWLPEIIRVLGVDKLAVAQAPHAHEGCVNRVLLWHIVHLRGMWTTWQRVRGVYYHALLAMTNQDKARTSTALCG